MADEMFVLLGWAWDVDAAARLAERHPVQVAEIRSLTRFLSWIRIDTDYAATVDLSRPLLVIPVPNVPTPHNRLVIDGWHRIHRALAEGLDRLPVILLEPGDERACRLHGGDIQHPDLAPEAPAVRPERLDESTHRKEEAHGR